MVHVYQRQLLENAMGKSKLLPSTVALLLKMLPQTEAAYTFGTPSPLSLAEQYKRNMTIMHDVSSLSGARFFGFLQPCAFCLPGDEWPGGKGEEYRAEARAFYREVIPMVQKMDFMTDATTILEGRAGVYKNDGVHLTPIGDQSVAKSIFEVVKPILGNKIHSSR
jgi:hypothetical protein